MSFGRMSVVAAAFSVIGALGGIQGGRTYLSPPRIEPIGRPYIGLSPSGDVISVIGGRFDGVMNVDTVGRLERLIKKGITVEFTAPGGGDDEGSARIAELLNAHESTFVVPAGALCASGCGAAYALTNKRAADPTSWFQVHRSPGTDALLKLYERGEAGKRVAEFFRGCGKDRNPLVDAPDLRVAAPDFDRILKEPSFSCAQLPSPPLPSSAAPAHDAR